MAQADSFPRDALQEIALDMADWLEASELSAVGARISATPLPIWDIKPGSSLREAAQNSGEWYHQILNEEGAFAYARSRVMDGHAEIIALGESPLVEAVEEALGALRGAGGDPADLRLLRSPQHYLTCLWIHREGGTDEIIVLQSQDLRTGERFDERSFLARLAALPPPGMTATAPRERRYRAVQVWGENRAQPVRRVER
jgi:hypothetical protein